MRLFPQWMVALARPDGAREPEAVVVTGVPGGIGYPIARVRHAPRIALRVVTALSLSATALR
jgi:hypothetical protein